MTFISYPVVWMGNNGSQFKKKYVGVRNLMSSIIVFANRFPSIMSYVVFAKCYLLRFHQNSSKREVLEKSKWDLFKVNATPLWEFFRVHICTSSGFKQRTWLEIFFRKYFSSLNASLNLNTYYNIWKVSPYFYFWHLSILIWWPKVFTSYHDEWVEWNGWMIFCWWIFNVFGNVLHVVQKEIAKRLVHCFYF